MRLIGLGCIKIYTPDQPEAIEEAERSFEIVEPIPYHLYPIATFSTK
jgi:hypothetical protein